MVGVMGSRSWNSVLPRQRLPVIIVCRDLVTDLISLVRWLEQTDHQNLILLNNDSTYPPLLEYLAASAHRVIRLDTNLGHTSPWRCGLTTEFGADVPFVVTDPDVLPDPEAPADTFEHLQELLLRHRDFDKAAFGLHIDDLPDRYPFRAEVIAWESPFWTKEIEPGAFAAHVDTTLAVHRPGTPHKVTEALRTGAPRMARHMPWYRDPRNPDPENTYYLKHRDKSVGYWNRETLHTAVARHIHGVSSDSPFRTDAD